MARNYDVTPKPEGGYEVRKRSNHVFAWCFYGLLLLGALLQPNIGVKIVGAVFVALTVVGIWVTKVQPARKR